jgi:hypothetical protein
MAIEARRGCGFRKIGGLYLVGEGIAIGCDRLPFKLDVCPCCNQGIKPTLGFTWVQSSIFDGDCTNFQSECHAHGCEICKPRSVFRDVKIDGQVVKTNQLIPSKLGLMWVGSRFYNTPSDFITEAQKIGVSKRIAALPKGIQKGDLVLLAHRQATSETIDGKTEKKAGIFYAFHITRIEKLVSESQSKDEEAMKKLDKRGITAVVIPDNDKDHQGTVYDKEEEPEKVEEPIGGA